VETEKLKLLVVKSYVCFLTRPHSLHLHKPVVAVLKEESGVLGLTIPAMTLVEDSVLVLERESVFLQILVVHALENLQKLMHVNSHLVVSPDLPVLLASKQKSLKDKSYVFPPLYHQSLKQLAALQKVSGNLGALGATVQLAVEPVPMQLEEDSVPAPDTAVLVQKLKPPKFSHVTVMLVPLLPNAVADLLLNFLMEILFANQLQLVDGVLGQIVDAPTHVDTAERLYKLELAFRAPVKVLVPRTQVLLVDQASAHTAQETPHVVLQLLEVSLGLQ